MQVIITYFDTTSLTKEEIVKQAKENYGHTATVEIRPVSNEPWDVLNFALQNLVTYDQISLLFDSGHEYQTKIKELKQSLLDKIGKELETVILDNEDKVT